MRHARISGDLRVAEVKLVRTTSKKPKDDARRTS